MHATTTGTAAMRAYVSRFGRANARADDDGFVVVVMLQKSIWRPPAQRRNGDMSRAMPTFRNLTAGQRRGADS